MKLFSIFCCSLIIFILPFSVAFAAPDYKIKTLKDGWTFPTFGKKIARNNPCDQDFSPTGILFVALSAGWQFQCNTSAISKKVQPISKEAFRSVFTNPLWNGMK